MVGDPNRKVILWLIAAWVALLLIFAFARYVRAEAGGCISHVEPGVEPVTICQVLWLPMVRQAHQPAAGGGQ